MHRGCVLPAAAAGQGMQRVFIILQVKFCIDRVIYGRSESELLAMFMNIGVVDEMRLRERETAVVMAMNGGYMG